MEDMIISVESILLWAIINIGIWLICDIAYFSEYRYNQSRKTWYDQWQRRTNRSNEQNLPEYGSFHRIRNLVTVTIIILDVLLLLAIFSLAK